MKRKGDADREFAIFQKLETARKTREDAPDVSPDESPLPEPKIILPSEGLGRKPPPVP
jgi:hypothetical protein